MRTINLLPKALSRQLQFELMGHQILVFWIWILITLVVFFILSLASGFYLKSSIGNVTATIDEQKEILSSSNTKELDARVQELNTSIANLENLQNQHYYWSEAMEEITRIIPGDMTIEALTLDRATGQVNITGQAQTRESILLFWSNIKKSEYFNGINFPLSNLEDATDGTYSYTFFVNPQLIQHELPN